MIEPEANIPDGIVNLNVGGQYFATSKATLIREPCSMLARMFSSQLENRTDEKVDEFTQRKQLVRDAEKHWRYTVVQGRTFIDRDPKHFRLILNYLRDGCCVLPADEAEMMELLHEVDFYQLDGLRSLVLGEDTQVSQTTAHCLRFCIANQIRMDPQLLEASELLIACAYGKGSQARTPSRRAHVVVLVRENAFNPLFPQPSVQARDEMLYVAFQQHIKFEGSVEKKAYFCKHEPHFIHEEGGLSYDPNVYGGSYEERFHIKTAEVYRHHCLHKLSESHRRLRDAALYIEKHSDALQWALELQGFKDVRLVFHSRQPELCDAPDSPPGSPSSPPTQGSHTSPELCNVRFDVHFSL